MQPVVIDSGSRNFRAGFAFEENPCVVLSTEKHSSESKLVGLDQTSYPVVRGSVTNWDQMETILSEVYQQEQLLNVSPEDHPVLLSESPFDTANNREKMLQVMFEKLNVPAAFGIQPAILSLYASGRTTGLVLELGEGLSYTLPIYDGYAFSKGILKFDLAGGDLTDYLESMLKQREYFKTTEYNNNVIYQIKESLCYVSSNLEAENSNAVEKSYTLPDGQVINLNEEIYLCPEALFRPSLLDLEFKGVHQLMYNSIISCDIDSRRDLFLNIVLSGGTTKLPRFDDRVLQEILCLVPSSVHVNVDTPQNRDHSVWHGGSIMASLSSFLKMSISKKEYEEYGSSIIHRKYV